MGVPDLIVFDETQVHQRIWSEAARYPHHETGGILIGQHFHIRGKHVLVVVAATGPGADADHQEATFSPDTKSLQLELESIRSRYSAHTVDYIGEWHKHPPGYHHPSLGDLDQAARILSDPAYHVSEGILTPIVTVEKGFLRVHVHYFVAGARHPMTLPAQRVVSIADQMDEVLAFLEEEQRQQRSPWPSRWGVAPEWLSTNVNAVIVTDAVDWTIEEGDGTSKVNDNNSDLVAEGVVRRDTPVNDTERLEFPPMSLGRLSRDYAELRRAAGLLRLGVGAINSAGILTVQLLEPFRLRLQRPMQAEKQGHAGNASDNSRLETCIRWITGLRFQIDHAYPAVAPLIVLTTSTDEYLQIDTTRLFEAGWTPRQTLYSVTQEILKRLQLQIQVSPQLLPYLSEQIGLMIVQSEIVVRKFADVLHSIGLQLSRQETLPGAEVPGEDQDVSNHP